MGAVKNIQNQVNCRTNSNPPGVCHHEIRMKKSKCPDMATFMFVNKRVVAMKQKDLRLRRARPCGKSMPRQILESIFDPTEPSSSEDGRCNNSDNEDDDDDSRHVKVFDAARGRDVTCLQTNVNFVDRFVSNVGPFMPLGLGMTHGGNLGSGPDIAMAFMPPWLSMSMPNIDDYFFRRQPATKQMWHRYFLASTLAQGVSGAAQFFLFGEYLGGILDMLMSGLGSYCVSSEDGGRYLPTYVFTCAFNGLVSGIHVISAATGNAPVFSVHFTFLMNASKLFFFAKPFILFSSAYCGWKYIKNCQASAYHVTPGDSAAYAEESEDPNSQGFFADLVANMQSVTNSTNEIVSKFQPFGGEGHTLGADEEEEGRHGHHHPEDEEVEFQVEEHENENFANENEEVERGDSSELD